MNVTVMNSEHHVTVIFSGLVFQADVR